MKLRRNLFRFSELGIWKAVYCVFLALLPLTSMPLVVRLVRSDVVAAPSGLILLVLLVGWAFPRLLGGDRLPENAFLLIGFVLAALMVTVLSFFRIIPPYKSASVTASSVSAVITLFIGFGFYLVSTLWNSDDRKRQLTLRVINWSGAVVLLWTLLQAFFWYKDMRYPEWMKEIQFFFSVGSLYRQRFVGFTLEPSWLAHQLNLLYLPWWFAASVTGASVHRFRYRKVTFERLLFVFGLAILFLTLSRVGLVAFLLTVIFFVVVQIFKRSGRWKRLKTWAGRLLPFALVLVVIPLVLLLIGWMLSRLDYRMANLFSLDLWGRSDPILYLAEKLSLAARFVYWDGGMEIFNAHPVFGVGLGHAGFYMPDALSLFALKLVEVRDLLYRTETLLNIKSIWIRVLAETGIVGFSFFFTWILRSWLGAFRQLAADSELRRALGWMGCFTLIAFLLEGFSLDTFALPYLWISTGLSDSSAFPSVGMINTGDKD